MKMLIDRKQSWGLWGDSTQRSSQEKHNTNQAPHAEWGNRHLSPASVSAQPTNIWTENGIGKVGTAALCEALKVNTTLYTLDISCTGEKQLTAKGLSWLSLRFTGNKIRKAGGVALGELLKVNTSLKSLRAGGEDTETEFDDFCINKIDL